MSQLVHADVLELVSLVVVHVHIAVTRAKNDLRADWEAPFGPRPVVEDRAGSHPWIELLSAVEELAQLRESFAKQQRAVVQIADSALLQAQRIDQHRVGLPPSCCAAI